MEAVVHTAADPIVGLTARISKKSGSLHADRCALLLLRWRNLSASQRASITIYTLTSFPLSMYAENLTTFHNVPSTDT